MEIAKSLFMYYVWGSLIFTLGMLSVVLYYDVQAYLGRGRLYRKRYALADSFTWILLFLCLPIINLIWMWYAAYIGIRFLLNQLINSQKGKS